MPAGSAKNQSILRRLREWASGGPATRPSLFHFVDDAPEPSVMPDLLDLLRHPIRAFKEERHAPHTRPSLFEYIAKPEDAKPLNWKELLSDLFTDYRFALFIPSLWADQRELVEERAELRTRRMESSIASLMIHVMLVGFAVYLAIRKVDPPPQKDPVVYINTPMNLPFESTGPNGGGGGGGGKNEKTPASIGRMPDTARFQYMPPDPGQPKPLVPSESPLDNRPTVQMPIDIPQDALQAIGDMMGPPGTFSSGPGSGGGIGTGSGTGVGPGKGPGYGPGEGGGMGGGRGGGIGNGVGPYVVGNGVTEPIPIFKPPPAYTEEARKARTEGVLLLQAIIRRDGTVDSFKVVRGLGYGLDESAINTIATKWKFKPGTFHGVPVDVQANIEVTFRLY
ncbi:MAG: energy transducer TonB [Acidobacteriota bacterium]